MPEPRIDPAVLVDLAVVEDESRHQYQVVHTPTGVVVASITKELADGPVGRYAWQLLWKKIIATPHTTSQGG